MGMELLRIETQVAQIEDARFGKERGFLDSIRSNASQALAERIARDASLYQRIEPTKEELDINPFAPVRHRWQIGVEVKMSELEARARQMDEARLEGRKEAAAICREMAARFDRVNGPCKHVIVNELLSAAREIESNAI